MSEANAAPIPAQMAPFKVSVQAGKTYYWCACGLSAKQPFCDGSHKGTALTPVSFMSDVAKDCYFCGCKATAKSPLCDGSHKDL